MPSPLTNEAVAALREYADGINPNGVHDAADEVDAGIRVRAVAEQLEAESAELHAVLARGEQWWSSYDHDTDAQRAQALIDACAYWHSFAETAVSAREVELAEALREVRDDMGACDCGDYPTCTYCKCVTALTGSPRSHEVVPLGTQEALRDLAARTKQMLASETDLDALVSALAAVDGLLAGAERGQRCPRCRGEVQWHPGSDDYGVCSKCGLDIAGVENSDVHRCADCEMPTNWAIGSYWLSSDGLWAQVVGDDSIVLCPACFTARAEAKDVHVSWRAVVEGVERTPTPEPADHDPRCTGVCGPCGGGGTHGTHVCLTCGGDRKCPGCSVSYRLRGETDPDRAAEPAPVIKPVRVALLGESGAPTPVLDVDDARADLDNTAADEVRF